MKIGDDNMPKNSRPPTVGAGDRVWKDTTFAEREQAQNTWDLLKAQEEANEIERKKLEQQKMQKSFDNFLNSASNLLQREEEDKEKCKKYNLDYDLIMNFYDIEYEYKELKWDDFIKGRQSKFNDILNEYKLTDVINQTFKPLNSKTSNYYIFNALAIICIVIAIMCCLVKEFLIGILFLILSGVFFLIKRRYKVFINERNKKVEILKSLFYNYIETGKDTIEKFIEMRKNNYIKEYDQLIEDITSIKIPQENLTRTEKLKLQNEKNNNAKNYTELGKEYNYKMAELLDNYDNKINEYKNKFVNLLKR